MLLGVNLGGFLGCIVDPHDGESPVPAAVMLLGSHGQNFNNQLCVVFKLAPFLELPVISADAARNFTIASNAFFKLLVTSDC